MTTETPVKASTDSVGKALAKQETTIKAGMSLKAMLSTSEAKRRFEEILGKKAPGFVSSIISAARQNPALEQDPQGVIAAAAIAASLDLPINSSLGFAHIVPYFSSKEGKMMAQFQIGWKGFVQLGMRSGQYKTLNVAIVYEGQLVKNDPFTGLMQFNAEGKKSDKIIGYVAYEQLLNGFEKYLYMTTEQARAHGLMYSQSFKSGKGKWVDNFDAMALKTVIKMLLSKWGVLSTDMQKAIAFDQAAIGQEENPVYLDGKDGVIDVEVPESKETPEETEKEYGVKVNGVTLVELDKKEAWLIDFFGDVKKYYTLDKSIADYATTAAKEGYSVISSTEKKGMRTFIIEIRKA